MVHPTQHGSEFSSDSRLSLGKVGFKLYGWRVILHQRSEVPIKTHLLYGTNRHTLFDIYSIVCNCHWEVEESALVCALAYFDEVLH